MNRLEGIAPEPVQETKEVQSPVNQRKYSKSFMKNLNNVKVDIEFIFVLINKGKSFIETIL